MVSTILRKMLIRNTPYACIYFWFCDLFLKQSQILTKMLFIKTLYVLSFFIFVGRNSEICQWIFLQTISCWFLDYERRHSCMCLATLLLLFPILYTDSQSHLLLVLLKVNCLIRLSHHSSWSCCPSQPTKQAKKKTRILPGKLQFSLLNILLKLMDWPELWANSLNRWESS